ncbi:hypothetical protein ACIBF1_06995 [Spirillospora sp. NPDC050679]
MAKDEFNDNTGTVHRGKGDINQNSGKSSRTFSATASPSPARTPAGSPATSPRRSSRSTESRDPAIPGLWAARV